MIQELLDPNDIPADPDRPGYPIVSRDAVLLINKLIMALEGTLVEALPTLSPEYAIGRIEAYGQTVRRAIAELSRSTAMLLREHKYLAAAIVARALMEHFAALRSLLDELRPLVASGKRSDALKLIERTAMRHTVEKLKAHHGAHHGDAWAPRASQVIPALERRKPHSVSDYEFLCQYGHPSAFSVWLMYGGDSHVRDGHWQFEPGGWDKEQTFKWAFVVLEYLRFVFDDLLELNQLAAALRDLLLELPDKCQG